MDADGDGEQVDFHKMPLDRRKSTSTTAGDGDTCRICRGEGTVDQPLFYPCKCSGSIKYVHQECLMEWLSHSQKKYCELCKTPFRFTKLYDTSMPATLPLPLFFRQVSVHAVRTLGRWLRYILVTFIWTCWLPWSIRQIWRGLFWLADGSWMTPLELKQLSAAGPSATNTSIPLANGTGLLGAASGPARTSTISYFDPVGELINLFTGAPLLKGLLRLITAKPIATNASGALTNATASGPPSSSPFARQPSLLSNVSSLNDLTKYQLVNNGLIDVLEGQLICLSVIAAFILVFLIREWVINQQPIPNMPNPDRADAQVAAVQPNEEARQPGRRRRRGARRIPDHDGPLDVAQRPLVAPLPRRALTIEDITTAATPEHALERPNIPARASSLVPASSSDHGIFSMDMDRETSWRPENSSDAEGIESPPLQRGMFDDVVDIRRNIEERTSLSPGAAHDEGFNDTEHITQRLENANFSLYSTANNDRVSDLVQRMDFVSDGGLGAECTQTDSTNPLTSSDPNSGTIENNSNEMENRQLVPNLSGFEDSDSSWEGLDHSQFSDHANPSDESLRRTVGDVVQIPQAADEPATPNNLNNEVLEVRDVADAVLPETTLDRIVQWMWHTDEGMRVAVQANEHVENGHVAHGLGVAHPPPVMNAAPANAIEAPVPAPIPAPAGVREPNVQFGIDLNDPNALDDAEDLEGILELIGMEGPLAGMVQNIIFSVFLITLTLSASVWCPYIWGKIAILVMSNPVGVFFKAPLFFVSQCGNVLVDMLLFVGGMVGYGLSNLAKVVKVAILPALPSLAGHIQVATIEHWTYGISQRSGVRLEKALSGTVFSLRPDLPTFSMQSHHALQVFRKAAVEASSAVSTDLFDTLKSAIESWRTHGLLGLPIFVYSEAVSFPGAVFSAAKKAVAWWTILADDLKLRPLSELHEHEIALVEWSTEDKVLAVLVGYAFFATAGYAYLKIAHLVLGLKQDEKVDGMFADSLRQAGGVLKVIVIIGIEMIAFPLYCGLLLDCALLPLFKGATFQSRLGFLMNAPVTYVFIHWFVGTCYMFHFALFVSMCRKIMRKGVLYFIRDPDDPTFHPVRDVLERPVATQLGKIAFSALVYGGLVIVCLGGVVWSISMIGGVLPVNWATNEPRLAFPVDIIFYNFMLPFILRQAEPSKKISSMYEWWFRQCARKLRLSHFLFGEDREDEKRESRSVWQPSAATDSISAIIDEGNPPSENISLNRPSHDGRYVRVPAADSVRIPKGTRVFVEVDENNMRIDGKPDHDTGLHGKKDERFTKIYIPPHFRGRVSIFIFLVWLFAASTGIAFTVVPLLVGRQLLRMAAASLPAPNDLYALTVGLHVCGALLFTGYLAISKRNRLRSKVSEFVTNTRESLPRLYQSLKYVAGLTYLIVTIFVVLPFATSLLTELYVHMPVYSYFAYNYHPITLSPKSASTTTATSSINPTIFVLQTWTLGLLYMRLALRLAISYPNGHNRPSTALRAIVRDGYLHPDVSLASRALIFPAISLCIILLAAPIGVARLLILITRSTNQDEKLRFYRYSYPVVLGIVVSLYIAIGVRNKIEGWRIKVRDDVYLVGERLHNFTDSDGKKNNKSAITRKLEKGKERADSDTNDQDTHSRDTDFDVTERRGARAFGQHFEAEDGSVGGGSRAGSVAAFAY